MLLHHCPRFYIHRVQRRGAKRLIEIENLIKQYNKTEKQCPMRLPDLKIFITGTQYGYKRDDDVFVVPIGYLKN